MADQDFSTQIARWMGRHQPQLLVALLVLLHLMVLQGPHSLFGRVLFLVHIGLALLWQPFVRTEQRLSFGAMAFVMFGVTIFVGWLNWWMVGAWMAVAAGVIGGRAILMHERWSRLLYLLALADLVMELLLLVLPSAVPSAELPAPISTLFAHYLLPILFIAMAALPNPQRVETHADAVDFVYVAFVFLLLSVLSLGSLAGILLFRQGYAMALLGSLLVTGGLLLILGWAWNPHAGFSGLGSLFSRYMLSVGLPIEQWLEALANLAQRHEDPAAFMDAACEEMIRRLPWVVGGEWSDGRISGHFGAQREYRREFHYGNVTLVMCSERSMSPALIWHSNLLAKLLGEFYEGKLRARQLKQLSYLEAIHETGARLTHDVKNLLQSLNALVAIARQEDDSSNTALTALMRRQLPAIAQRLTQTLEKLQLSGSRAESSVRASEWAARFDDRYSGQGIKLVLGRGCAARDVPCALFDSVTETLVQNAIEKRRNDRRLLITVSLEAAEAGVRLEVGDDGNEIPKRIAEQLLHGPVPSENGLGIGIFQAARQAAQYDYRLELAENQPGCVRFSLAPA